MSEDKNAGRLRMICQVCGQDIPSFMLDTSGASDRVFTFRHGGPTGFGWVHPDCTDGRGLLDLTGKPDYSDYNRYRADPAFPSGFDAVQEGAELDAAMQEEAAKVAARKHLKERAAGSSTGG